MTTPTQHRIGPVTERLIHRAFVPDDDVAFHRLNSHPDVVRTTGEPPVASVEVARAAIEAYPDWDRYGYGRWACVLREQGPDAEPIGFCGLKFLEERGEVDVGYRFLPEYWGRGLATEAAIASLRFGFDTLALPSICALVLPGNAGSMRVLEKSGMRRQADVIDEGIAVQRWVATRRTWEDPARR